jgi:hypothetical protein
LKANVTDSRSSGLAVHQASLGSVGFMFEETTVLLSITLVDEIDVDVSVAVSIEQQ